MFGVSTIVLCPAAVTRVAGVLAAVWEELQILTWPLRNVFSDRQRQNSFLPGADNIICSLHTRQTPVLNLTRYTESYLALPKILPSAHPRSTKHGATVVTMVSSPLPGSTVQYSTVHTVQYSAVHQVQGPVTERRRWRQWRHPTLRP